MKIFLTGASGYIGNKLACTLATQGHTVHALIRNSTAENILRHPMIKIFKGDLRDKESILESMKGCSQVYHTAGIARLWSKNRDIFYEQNVGCTIHVLEAALACSVKKFVYTSSCGVWSPAGNHLHTENDPRIGAFDNDYDLSKYLAEKAVREYGQKGLFTVIVNPPRVYGPGLDRSSSAVNRYIQLLLFGKISPLPWHLDAQSNYSFIDDVVHGHILAMEKGLGGERYILGGENISYRRFVNTIKELNIKKKLYLRIPGAVLKAWSSIELLRGKISNHVPVVTPKMIERFSLDKMFDCSKAVKQLGYKITPFEQGLRTTIKYLVQQHKNKHHA
jgi:nucleoside-diphosphate-sugar epimerase